MSGSGRDEKQGGGSGRTTFVTEIQPNDVLMGRGAPISDNTGNIRYLHLIREKCTGYQQTSTRKEKDAIARQVVSTIHARNGLFLRKIDSPDEAMELGVPPQVEAWTTADEKTVLIKIKQALRDRGLEVKEQGGTGTPPPQDHASAATELSAASDCDEMVAHGGLSSLYASAQQQPPPPAKRAKSQSFQDQTPSDTVSQTPVASKTTYMPVPNIQLPAAATGMNQFQGIPERIPNLELFSNFSHGFNRGTPLISQPSLFTPHLLSHEQNWNNASAAAAGLNLPPVAGLHSNIQQLDRGTLQADFRAAFATSHAQAAANNAQLQLKGQDLKTDKKLSASTKGLNNETTGEIALRIACDVYEMGQSSGIGVKLDPIELCLLSVLNSRGLPTWSSTQFQNGDIFFIASNNNNNPYPLAWSDIGNHLVQEVQSFLFRKTSKLFPNDTPNQRGSAIQGFVSRLVSIASAYSKNPTNLARMTVMLLEKLRMPTAAAGASAASDAARTSPGIDNWGSQDPPRGVAMDSLTIPSEVLFQTYITTELSLWAASLNIADDIGFPVPFNMNDFVARFPQYVQYEIFSTAAILDAFGCRAVLCQVAFLTRLRSLFQKCSSDQTLSILRASKTTPRWGSNSMDETALLDMSLLQALLANGFSGLLDLTKTDDLLGMLLMQKSITKADVEKRVVQLIFLLHTHVQSMKITQVINQQAANVVQMIGF